MREACMHAVLLKIVETLRRPFGLARLSADVDEA
jgi:hypothetical protein